MIKGSTQEISQGSICSRNTGVALLTMLLVLVLVTTITANMFYKNYLEIKRQQSLMANAQSAETIHGAISLAKIWLRQPRVPSQQKVFQPDNGRLYIKLEDQMGKFNLNNLRTAKGDVNSAQLQIYKRLLSALAIDQVDSLANSLADWVDSDSISLGYNSEDLGYSVSHDGRQSYRAANRAMAHSSELLLVKGYNQNIVDLLSPYVTALPKPTAVNINTASPVLLQAVIPGINGQQVVDARSQLDHGLPSIEAFLKHPATAGVEIPAELLSTDSQYFLLVTQLVYSPKPINSHEPMNSHQPIKITSTWQALFKRSQADDLSWQANILWLEQLPFWQPGPTLITYE